MTDASQVEIGKSTVSPWDVGLMNINDGHGRDTHCLVVVSNVTRRIVCSVSPSHLLDAEDAGNVCLLSAAPDLLAAAKQAEQFISAIMGFYGQNLEVANWHQNGDTEPFDNFIDENNTGEELSLLRAAIAKAIGKSSTESSCAKPA